MQRAIMEGQYETGITTQMMADGIDTGDILLISKVAIEEDDNFETIHDKLGECGAETLLATIKELREGTLTRTKQDDSLATYAAKIEKADCVIDFTKSANEVHNQIRGLSPIPLSFTYTPDGKMLKVCATEVTKREGTLAPCGTVLSLSGGKIEVACGVGSVAILSVLPEGKKRMTAADFINGRKIAVGDVLSAQ